MGCLGAVATVFPGDLHRLHSSSLERICLTIGALQIFNVFCRGWRGIKVIWVLMNQGLQSQVGSLILCGLLRWSHQEVSLRDSHFFHPNCHPINGLAERDNTCPAYRQTDFTKKGLNKMIFFLALETEEASSTVTNPQLCRRGRKSVLQRREALVSSRA